MIYFVLSTTLWYITSYTAYIIRTCKC